jgi:hypothetical protein
MKSIWLEAYDFAPLKGRAGKKGVDAGAEPRHDDGGSHAILPNFITLWLPVWWDGLSYVPAIRKPCLLSRRIPLGSP